MARRVLPEVVVEFINKHIDSVEQLEILLLLRQHPEREWSVHDVNELIRSSLGSVSKRLVDLSSRGLLASRQSMPEQLYKYAPITKELEKTITELSETYRDQRTRVIESIFSKPLNTIQGLADAFKIGKKDG